MEFNVVVFFPCRYQLLYVLLPSVLDENPFDIADQRQKMAKSLTRQGERGSEWLT